MHIRTIACLPFFFILLSTAGVGGQSAILPAGGDATGSGGAVSYSVGQIDFTDFTGEEGHISLGVQQTYVLIMVNTESPAAVPSARVYPNPVMETLTLELSIEDNHLATARPHLELFNLEGKLLLRQELARDLTRLPVDHLSNEVYFLKVVCNDKEIQTFKIFKTN